MYRSLNILKIVCGENHPDISSIYLNLGLMYQDFENFQAAIDCFLESLYRNISLFGENHIQVASCYQAIAHAYFQLMDYRKALDNQEKAHKILTKILPADDQYIKNSLAQMEQFVKLSVYVEKVKNAEKSSRPIGSNKTAAPQKQVKGQEASKLSN
jgi:protein TIF31